MYKLLKSKELDFTIKKSYSSNLCKYTLHDLKEKDIFLDCTKKSYWYFHFWLEINLEVFCVPELID